MSEWKIPAQYQIEYKQSENIASISQKTIALFNLVFEYLNELKTNNAVAGLDASDTSAYQIRINTSDNGLYIRNKDNNDWIYLGDIEENFGITPSSINAIANGGKISKISGGLDADKPTENNNSNDLYIAFDDFTIYRWTGSVWQVLVSLKFENLHNYEKYCVNRDEIAANGKGKIPRLDERTGKGNFDITGSPERLLDYEIDVQELKDGDVFVYNAEKSKIVNLPKDEIKKTDLTVNGEAGKIVKVAADGKIHATLEGSASALDLIEVDTTGIEEGQVLTLQKGKFKPANKDKYTEDDITTTGEKNKIVRVAANGRIYGTLQGSASGLDGVEAALTGMTDGQTVRMVDGKLVPADFDIKYEGNATKVALVPVVLDNLEDGQGLIYHIADNTFKNEEVGGGGGGSTVGKSLIFKNGDTVLGDYNGRRVVVLDFKTIVAQVLAEMLNE